MIYQMPIFSISIKWK